MKLYKPIFTNKWEIWEVESDECRKMGRELVNWRGTLLNDNFYTTEEGARLFISKEDWKAAEFSYSFDRGE